MSVLLPRIFAAGRPSFLLRYALLRRLESLPRNDLFMHESLTSVGVMRRPGRYHFCLQASLLGEKKHEGAASQCGVLVRSFPQKENSFHEIGNNKKTYSLDSSLRDSWLRFRLPFCCLCCLRQTGHGSETDCL